MQPVRRLLAASVYIARNEPQDGGDPLDEPVGRWEPIVNDETFRQARESVARYHVYRNHTTNRWLLSGFARCPRCGHKMVGWVAPGKSPRYVCDVAGCRATVHGPSLDASVMEQLVPVLAWATDRDPAFRRALSQEWDTLRAADAPDATRLSHLNAAIEKGRSRLAGAATLFVDGDLDRAGYDAMREQIEADTRAAQDELDRLESKTAAPTLPTLTEALARVGNWATALDAGEITARRRVLGEIVARVSPEKVAYGRYGAMITWTALGDALRIAVAKQLAA
jgi:hypothetical protein